MQIEKLIEVLEIAIAAEKTEPPNPKYTDFTETKSGLIVGRHWVCLMQAWEESGLPGWHYTVKTSKRLDGCSIIHENDIELLERPESTVVVKVPQPEALGIVEKEYEQQNSETSKTRES